MLHLVDELTQTQRIQFLPADEQSRNALAGKRHQGNKAEGRRLRLMIARTIARELERGGFVAYHSDSDRRWSERSPDDFPDFRRLRAVVEGVLSNPPTERGHAIDPERINRLFLLGAYWEIEAWLYQNTAKAKAVCKQTCDAAHHDQFDEWAANRASLDDLADPKDVCCLADRHNQVLAESAYPASEAYFARASFAACVDRLGACPDLVAALAGTHAS